MRVRGGSGVATGTAWTVLLAAADTSSEGPKCPSARVLHGLGALAKPGAKRQTQAGVAGWPDFVPDFAEEPGLIEPYLSAIRVRIPIHAAPTDLGRASGVADATNMALPAELDRSPWPQMAVKRRVPGRTGGRQKWGLGAFQRARRVEVCCARGRAHSGGSGLDAPSDALIQSEFSTPGCRTPRPNSSLEESGNSPCKDLPARFHKP